METTIINITTAAVQVVLGRESCIYTGNLSNDVYTGVTDSGHMPLRDMVRLVFAELGVEIEFSGKNEREKGVVIDIDEAYMHEMGLHTDMLRFGQTVVKVGPQHIETAAINSVTGNAPTPESEQLANGGDTSGHIKKVVAAFLEQIKKG